jgi:tRNA(fMet)-specific endonuclease VapC
MRNYLLDTNICVFFLRGKYALNRKIEAAGFDNCYISEITLAELKYGAECSNKTTENRTLIAEFAKEIKTLPVLGCFDIYAQEKAKLRKSGNLIDDFDLLIAASAIFYNLTLITDNIKHFDRISQIDIENWIER